MKPKILTSQNDILSAQRLVYSVYTGELSWRPEQPNPSNWIESIHPDGSYFQDKFDPMSSWFGVVGESEQLIAAVRLILPVEKKLELEHYHHLPSNYTKGSAKLVEINRLAIKKEFLQTPAPVILALQVFEHIADPANAIDYVFIGASSPELQNLCQSMGFELLGSENEFRYFKSDPFPTKLMALDCTNKPAIERVIANFRKIAG